MESKPGQGCVLLVEDEEGIAETVGYALRTEGYTPIWCRTGGDALEVMERRPVSLVILDIGLPDRNGFDLCREIRCVSDVPIIFLTARDHEIDRIAGLEMGADDYLAKPFSPRELTARVRAILRRARSAVTVQPASSTAALPCVSWRHDEERCSICHQGIPLDLTRNEYRLLAVLLKSPGRVYSREQLMNAAWPDPEAAFERTVDAHVKSLRAKLRQVAPGVEAIVTHRGLGYSFQEGL